MREGKTGCRQGINFTSGIGRRINEISRLVGGKKRLAQAAGLSESQLHRIVSGESQAKIENVAAMAIHCGVSIDWLATGRTVFSSNERETVKRDDGSLLSDVLVAVEEYLEVQAIRIPAARKAEMVALLYEYALARGGVPGDAVARFLRLVTG